MTFNNIKDQLPIRKYGGYNEIGWVVQSGERKKQENYQQRIRCSSELLLKMKEKCRQYHIVELILDSNSKLY